MNVEGRLSWKSEKGICTVVDGNRSFESWRSERKEGKEGRV